MCCSQVSCRHQKALARGPQDMAADPLCCWISCPISVLHLGDFCPLALRGPFGPWIAQAENVVQSWCPKRVRPRHAEFTWRLKRLLSLLLLGYIFFRGSWAVLGWTQIRRQVDTDHPVIRLALSLCVSSFAARAFQSLKQMVEQRPPRQSMRPRHLHKVWPRPPFHGLAAAELPRQRVDVSLDDDAGRLFDVLRVVLRVAGAARGVAARPPGRLARRRHHALRLQADSARGRLGRIWGLEMGGLAKGRSTLQRCAMRLV